MNPRAPDRREELRRRKLSNLAIRGSIRELGIRLALLNYQVSARLELKDVDLDCLNLVDQYGPLSPSALARMSRLHPATMTGIVDRLEHGGWVARERDPADRRAVLVRGLPARMPDLFLLYQGMSTSMNEICAGYTNQELELVADFLQRTASAGRAAADQIAGS
jgi:DNA-binding MarR family transcriptional regulator